MLHDMICVQGISPLSVLQKVYTLYHIYIIYVVYQKNIHTYVH